MSSGKIISMNERRDDRYQIDRENAIRIVDRCQACLSGQIPHLIRELFEHADDDMYKLADKSDQDIIETQYFAAMRQLRKLRDSIEASFVLHLKTAFSDFWQSHNLLQRSEPGSSIGDLALVGNDELEEQLAIDAMIAKAEGLFSLELQGLGERFAKLARVEVLEPKDNPIGPCQFVEGMHQIDCRVRSQKVVAVRHCGTFIQRKCNLYFFHNYLFPIVQQSLRCTRCRNNWT